MNSFRYAALLTVLLVTTACGSTPGGDDGGGNGGGSPDSAGTLLTHGSNMIHTLALGTTPEWSRLGTFDASHLPAASPRTDRLYIARHTLPDEFTVGEYDLQNLTDPLSGFSWPGTSLADAMRAMAFSADGRHVAGIISSGAGNRLSVLNIEGDDPVEVVSELSGGTGGYGLAWLDNDCIAFVLNVSDQDAPEVADFDAAVVSLDVSEHVTTGSLDLQVHVGITGDSSLLVNEIRDLAVSPGGNRLVYSYGDGTDPNLMLKDLTEPEPEDGLTQLTSGPHPHVGAAFSPDGTMVAFAEYISSREPGVFAVPIDLGTPIHIEDSGVTRERYWLADGLATRILAWLP